VNGQISFSRNDAVVVLDSNNDTLKNPWAGGLNSVQFSELDLNIDGINDLVVFDRTGNRISTYINAGTPNKVTYKHAPIYLPLFPEMSHWALFRDYNCDGKMDIYTYHSGGVRIYKNTSTTVLSFALEDSLVYSNFNPDSITPNMIPIYVSGADLPAIDDIDGDGDLDILTFDVPGTRVVYHKNLSIENHGTCDSINYELRNKCWGFFEENAVNSSIVIYDTCSFNTGSPEKYTGGNKHAGSSLFSLDIDASGSKEIVLGDVSANNLTLLVNGDSSPNLTASSITAVDTAFPANHSSTIPVDLYSFPAGFYLDVNNDNKKDLISSTNNNFNCLNDSNVWFYENTNATNNPNFNFVQTNFLQDGMIEVGEGAHPVFFDYNADGLQDLIIGSYGLYNPSTIPNHKASLWLYENVGSAGSPTFKLITQDYLGISSMNLDFIGNQPAVRLLPTFGDLDGDGDEDMLIGDFYGYLSYFENSAGPGNPVSFSLNTVNYQNIDAGLYASPQLIDLNRDNLLDLVIGERYGYFRYYENIGTSTAPNFSLTNDSLGNVHSKRANEFAGNSTPFIFDDGGSYVMLSGSINGYIYRYGNIDGNLNGTFTLMDSTYLNIWEGSQTAIHGKDIDNDGVIDVAIGNYSGGVALYKGDIPTVIKPDSKLSEILISPNPTQNIININLGNNDFSNSTIEILDLLGKTVYKETVTQQQLKIDLNKLTSGVYLVRFSNTVGNQVKKIIKK
jgi:hypothetical protein